MRIIFMGTDKFAVPALEGIINSGIEIACVITQPDRPKGRKLKLSPSPIKEVALGNGLPLSQPKRVRDKDFVEQVLVPLNPDLIVVAAFGQILPKEILDLPPYGCANIHPSLLPRFRGAAPIQRSIMEGEKETGVTIMFMDEGEDTGDIILQEKMRIEISDTAETLSHKLAGLSTGLIRKVLRLAQSGTIPRQAQNHSKATYAPKLKKEDGLIDWKKSAFEIHNLIRGTVPWPCAYTTFGEAIQLKIWESQIPELSNPDVSPGTIVDIIADTGIAVATGEGKLIITTVQPPSKSRMRAVDFVNGYRVKTGDMFS